MTALNTMSNKLNILVVEDKPENIREAKLALAEHNLTIVSGFDQAITALNRPHMWSPGSKIKFDVVLTDCMFPKGGMACMGPEGKDIVNRQGEMPYGPMVVFHAIQSEVPNIGLITQGCHHKDPFVFAFDHLSGWKSDKVNVVITNRLCRFVHTENGQPFDGNDYYQALESGRAQTVKDWKALLKKVLGLPDGQAPA